MTDQTSSDISPAKTRVAKLDDPYQALWQPEGVRAIAHDVHKQTGRWAATLDAAKVAEMLTGTLPGAHRVTFDLREQGYTGSGVVLLTVSNIEKRMLWCRPEFEDHPDAVAARQPGGPGLVDLDRNTREAIETLLERCEGYDTGGGWFPRDAGIMCYDEDGYAISYDGDVRALIVPDATDRARTVPTQMMVLIWNGPGQLRKRVVPEAIAAGQRERGTRERRMLDIAVAHLPVRYQGEGLSTVPGVCAYQLLRRDWIMWIPTEPRQWSALATEPVPEEILRIQLLAREHGCDYVFFDRRKAPDPGLPLYPTVREGTPDCSAESTFRQEPSMNSVDLELTGVDLQGVGVHGWVVKTDAVTALKLLRTRGLNASKLETFHPARTRFRRLWVIGRPDQIAEFTWLMAVNGTWLRGRLYDGHLSPVRWVSAPASLRIPATFSHLTKTVSDASRHERYRAKSNGSCGRWTPGEDSVAVCTSGWKSYTSTRGEAHENARYHRDHPGGDPPK